jgi:hypothetical protein
MSANIHIAIINAATVLTDAEIVPVVAALSRQVREHFAPAYGYDAELKFVPRGQTSPDGYSQLLILDTSDDASALGYHDLTADGKPLGKSFAKSDIDGGYSWTITLSHELLEMLADPDINLVVGIEGAHGEQLFYAYEVCDAVEADGLGYEIDGIKVSNFVLPSYFESFHSANTKYDYCGVLKAPIPEMAADGYLSVFNPASAQGWTQIYPRRNSVQTRQNLSIQAMRPRLGSRRERRRTPRSQWLRSEPKGT